MERLTAFESGFMYVVIEELGNRILADGMHYDTDISKFIQPKLDIFQENHYSVFDALVSVCQTNNLKLSYHFGETMDIHVIGVNGNQN